MNRHRIIVAIALLSAALCHAAAPQRPQAPPIPADASFEQLAEQFQIRYKIELTTSPPAPPQGASVKFALVPARDPLPLRRLRVLAEELDRYSPAMLRATRIQRIALVANLSRASSVHDDATDGTTYYLNVDARPEEPALRHSFHFAMSHSVLRRFTGEMGALEPRWLTLNAPDFRYGGGGKVYRPSTDIDHQDAPPGFCSLYSKAGALEDKAEVFAMLMVPNDVKWMRGRTARDPILAAKAKYVQSLIDYFKDLPDTPEQKKIEELFDLAGALEPRQMGRQLLDDREKVLKASGEIINERGWGGRTALLVAVMHNQGNLPYFVIREGADPKIADEEGFTPLHAAAFLGNHIIVRNLLDAGADSKAKDRFGGTPLDWAKHRNNRDAMAELQKLRPKVPPAR